MARALTIFVRHELERHERELMAALGVAVVIDRDAPACAFKIGAAGARAVCRRCVAIDRQRRDGARALAGELQNRARRRRSG